MEAPTRIDRYRRIRERRRAAKAAYSRIDAVPGMDNRRQQYALFGGFALGLLHSGLTSDEIVRELTYRAERLGTDDD